MATPSFYHPDLAADTSSVELSSNEASHAVKSRRLRVGQEVKLLNGVGLVAQAKIAMVENRRVVITVDSVETVLRQNALTIATAIPKGDRQKVMIDMLTQLGVSRIIPLVCEHSVSQFKTNMHEKWQRVAIEACKQSQNPWLPKIDPALSAVDLLASQSQDLFFADAQGMRMADLDSYIGEPIVMIGPEGGFSPAERQLFHDNGIKSITLGGHILRTETAAISAAAQFLQGFRSH